MRRFATNPSVGLGVLMRRAVALSQKHDPRVDVTRLLRETAATKVLRTRGGALGVEDLFHAFLYATAARRSIERALKDCSQRQAAHPNAWTALDRSLPVRYPNVYVHFLCVQRGAGVCLNISAKFWQISRFARPVVGYRTGH